VKVSLRLKKLIRIYRFSVSDKGYHIAYDNGILCRLKKGYCSNNLPDFSYIVDRLGAQNHLNSIQKGLENDLE